MRLAIITNVYPPEARGGAGRVAYALVEEWEAQGHEVRVFTHRATWLTRGFFVRLLGHLFSEYRLPPFTNDVLAWKPDCVITHNLTGCGLLSIGRWFNRQPFAWIHILHDVQLFEPSGLLQEDSLTLWQCVWSFYRRCAFGHPQVVVSPTQWLLDAHHARGWLKDTQTRVLPNPLPAQHDVMSQESRAGWLFVGRVAFEKGADTLYELFARRPEEQLVVIGEGERRTKLQTLPNVQCLGEQPSEVVAAWMQRSVGLLMPSIVQENQPNVLLEAMVHGVPIIASDVGGVRETLGKDGGILCSNIAEGGIEAWMEACDRLLHEQAFWQEKSSARAHALAYDPAYWEAVFALGRSNSKTHTAS